MELGLKRDNSALLLTVLCTLLFITSDVATGPAGSPGSPGSPRSPGSSGSLGGDPQATCIIQPLGLLGNNISGVIKLWQLSAADSVHVVGNLTGFLLSGPHGFHVHVSGDLRNNCMEAGPHYNPFNNSHGAPTDTERHAGDLGNINVVNGWSIINITDNIISLVGDYSIVNRSLVVHSGEDDLGRENTTESKETGNSGGRIGCCTITLDPDTTDPNITATITTIGPTQPGSSAVATPIEPFTTDLLFYLCAAHLILAKVL